MRLLILPDPANVFAPSDNAILLPLSLPEAPIGILPTTSPPARSTAEVDMSAFDEDMAASSSSLSSILKRGRNSPAKGPIVGTKVRILSLRMRAFLLFSMGVLEAFFYRGVRKVQISLPIIIVSARSNIIHANFSAIPVPPVPCSNSHSP